MQQERRVRRFGGLMFALWLALLLPVLTPALHAQAVPARSGVEGTVLDPDSKAIVGAAVVIRNEGTGAIITATTDGSGQFAARDLAPGTYAVEVFVPGFETVRRSGDSRLGGRRRRRSRFS